MDDFREYLELVMIMAIPAPFFCGILAGSMHKDRSRYRNTFLVMFAGMSVLGLLCTMSGKYFAIVFFLVCILILLSILMTPFCLVLNGVVMMRKEGKSLANLLSLYWPSALIREFVAVHRELKHAILFVIGWLFFASPVLIDIFSCF